MPRHAGTGEEAVTDLITIKLTLEVVRPAGASDEEVAALCESIRGEVESCVLEARSVQLDEVQ